MTPTNLFAKKGWLTPLGLLGGHTGGAWEGVWSLDVSHIDMRK